ncbi:MAG TPA: manno-octulosonate cytidylyltransferase [Pyrinomonadaceae bacterium]|nr:manno-octulosonate cytidylyltransferase [Pyrinomonadaceae bacterium]
MNLTGTQPQTNSPTNIVSKAVAIIPARFASSRFPGKALEKIGGRPMICCVAERAAAAQNVTQVIVATDDQRISEAVRAAGFEAVMTLSDHDSGTDRIAEVAAKLVDVDIIVNVQGDEPLISPETIERAVEALDGGIGEQENGGRGDRETGRRGDEEIRGQRGQEFGIVTTWEPIDSVDDVLNPDVVKIVVDNDSRALYFSRSPVPYPHEAARKYGSIEAALRNDPELLNQFRKHTGLYVYRIDVLLALSRWPQSVLERAESLEQLRALEHGVRIKAVEAATRSIGVDTEDDLERVRKIVSSRESRVLSAEY